MKNLSYSSAGEFEKCSYRYHLKYDQGMWIDATAVNLELGSTVHRCIELYLEDLKAGLDNPPKPLDRIPAVLQERYGRFPIHDDLEELKAIARVYYKLYQRASATYTGPDPIRTKSGDVPSAPHMTTAWGKALKAANIEARTLAIDSKVWEVDSRVWAGVSFTEIFVQAMLILVTFQLPPDFKQVLEIEFPLSELVYATNEDGSPVLENGRRVVQETRNAVVFPETTVPFKGFIDLIYLDTSDQVRILDWKTSKKCPDVTDVMFMDQPNLYAHFYHDLTGIQAARIEIGHLRSGQVVSAPVYWPHTGNVVQRYVSITEAIQKKAYKKHSPTEYNNECVRDQRGQKVICPYISTCHKEYAEARGLIPAGPPDEDE